MSTKNNSTENNSKAIIFARVSTESQDYTEQVNRMKRVALADEYKEENLIVISNKESAIKLAEEERQGLQQLKDAVKNNPAVNAVYVFEISRLGRRMDVIASVVNWLKDNHIQLVCDEPNIRLFERSGKVSQAAEILIYLMGVLAEQEMKIKKERFANGKKRAKSLGRFTGGSVKWGYTLNQKKEIVVDESKTNIITTIFNMYVEGQGNEAIANYMNEMGIAYRKSKTYTRSRVAKFICDEQYRKIVGDELFDRAQSVREGQNKNTGKERKMSLGERLIKCQDCGRNYRLVGRNYVCSGHKKEYKDSGIAVNGKALYCDNSTNLNSRFVDASLVVTVSDWYAADLMKDESVRRDEITKELSDIPFKIKKIEKDIEKLQGKKDRIAELYEDGMIEKADKEKKFAKVDSDMKNAVSEKENLETRMRVLQSQQIDSQNFFRNANSVDEMTHSELYELVHSIVDRVDVRVENGVKYWTIHKKNSDKTQTYFSYGKGCGVKLFWGTDLEHCMEVTKTPAYLKEYKMSSESEDDNE